MLSVAAVVRAFRVVATCANPRLASLARRPCRSVLEPQSPRSLFTRARLVSSPVLLVSQHFLFFFVIMLALTPASSTPAPCPWSLFATLVTSRRRVHERRRRGSPCAGSSCSSSSPGNPLPLCTRSDSRSVQSSFGNTSSPRRNHCLPLSRHQRLTPPCS